MIAFSDELHQIYSLNRTAKITDVAIDTLGIITGIVVSITCCMIGKKVLKKGE